MEHDNRYMGSCIGASGTGISNSLVCLATYVLVATAFKNRRNLALAFMSVAMGVAQSILPPLLAALQDRYSWRGCFLISTGLYLNLILSTFVITSKLGLPLPFIKKGFREKKSQTNWKELYNPIYLCLVCTAAVSLTVTINVFVAIVDVLRSKGISEETSLSLLITFCCVGLFLRLFVGVRNQIKMFHSMLLFSICSTVAGCSVIVVAHTKNFIVMVIFLCLMWGSHGGMISLLSIIILDVTSVDVMPISFGISVMMIGAVTPVGSVIMGWLFDTRRSYELSFRIYGGLAVVSGLLMFVLFDLHRRSKQKR